MDEFIAQMRENNVEIVTEPFQPGPTIKAAFVAGPEGTLFEVIEKSEG
jgi:hypothetical protein